MKVTRVTPFRVDAAQLILDTLGGSHANGGPLQKFNSLSPLSAFFLGIISFIVLGGVLLASFVFTFGGSDYTITRILYSPDVKYRAILSTEMGGGAAGWCSQQLLIQSAAIPQPTAEDLPLDDAPIFTVSCSSDVAIHWRDRSQLHVAYTMSEYGVRVFQSPQDRDGAVHVTYELTEATTP